MDYGLLLTQRSTNFYAAQIELTNALLEPFAELRLHMDYLGILQKLILPIITGELLAMILFSNRF